MGSAGSPAGEWCIGLDVGGTKIAGGVVDPATGAVLARRQIPTGGGRDGPSILRDAVALAEALVSMADAAGHPARAIGVGVAELVDLEGTIRSAHSLDWSGRTLSAAFAHLAPATVESDVRAAALAEARLGAGQPFSTFVYVTVGTGISSCLVLEGRPYAGARGNALVLASAPLTSICERCGARQDQVLEDVAAGPALAARYSARINRPVAGAQEVMLALAQGDQDAAAVVRAAAEALGNSVGWLVNVLDPAAVVVGGGLGLAGGPFWDSFVTATRAHIWSEATRDLPIVTAGLGVDSGFVGAALAAADAGGDADAGHHS